MTLRWSDKQGVSTVNPQSDVTLSVVIWRTNSWGWHIEKGPAKGDGTLPMIAMGKARTRKQAKIDAEQRWDEISAQ